MKHHQWQRSCNVTNIDFHFLNIIQESVSQTYTKCFPSIPIQKYYHLQHVKINILSFWLEVENYFIHIILFPTLFYRLLVLFPPSATCKTITGVWTFVLNPLIRLKNSSLWKFQMTFSTIILSIKLLSLSYNWKIN